MGNDQKFGYGLGLRGGYRPIPSLEIGVLGAAWNGDGNLLVGALIGLLQFNGVVPLGATASFFGGAQLGLVYRRMDIQRSDMSGATYSDGVMKLGSFGYGLQAGLAVRIARNMSLRLELAWLHANGASKTHTSSSGGTLEDHMDDVDFVHADAAFCFAF
jgi:opacity protein-like surface antigen